MHWHTRIRPVSACKWTVPCLPQTDVPAAAAPAGDTVPRAAQGEGWGPGRRVREPGPAWPKGRWHPLHPLPRWMFASLLPYPCASAPSFTTAFAPRPRGLLKRDPQALSLHHSPPTQLGMLAQRTRDEGAHIQLPNLLQRKWRLEWPIIIELVFNEMLVLYTITERTYVAASD